MFVAVTTWARVPFVASSPVEMADPVSALSTGVSAWEGPHGGHVQTHGCELFLRSF